MTVGLVSFFGVFYQANCLGIFTQPVKGQSTLHIDFGHLERVSAGFAQARLPFDQAVNLGCIFLYIGRGMDLIHQSTRSLAQAAALKEIQPQAGIHWLRHGCPLYFKKSSKKLIAPVNSGGGSTPSLT